MPEHRFDELTRLIGARSSRRGLLKGALGLAAGGILSRFGRTEADAGNTRQPAAAPATDAFQRTWERTDRPVAEGQTARTWMWGPEAFTDAISEPYQEAPSGQRTVQYFDKARMEDNSFRADGPPWDVTNGLLVVELISGRVQLGDSQFEDRQPAQINVAGDANDPNGPTYATFGSALDAPPSQVGATITQIITRAGMVSNAPGLAEQGVTVAIVDDVTNHSIATPFWEFMNSSGIVYEDGQFITAPLFDSPYFATGRPITEPYWAGVLVGGTERLVLMQCFERRCLTYTPGNPDGFVVEAGNVGQHYNLWRTAPPQDVSIGDASPEVETQLAVAAGGNSHYQQLIEFLTFEGFATIGQSTTAISGPGLVATHFLSTGMETSPPDPLQATVIFDPNEGGEALIYAMVASAEGSLQYLLSVAADGFVEPFFPPSNAGRGPGSTSYLTGPDPCTVCLDSCVNLPELRDYVKEQSLDACLDIAHAICGTTAKQLYDAFEENDVLRRLQFCVTIVGSRCLQQASVSTCQEICYYDCANCELCQGDDPASYCCDGRCADLTQDGNNCGGCGVVCYPGQICCDGICLDPTDDDQNCGGCGNVCSDEQNCINGVCVDSGPCDACLPSETCCEDMCVDLQSNGDHCGSCGIECPAGTDCINGACVECTTDAECSDCEVCNENGRCQPCEGTCCNDGTCVPDDVCCPELINCGFGLCCGGDYPICCYADGYCCSAQYPICCGNRFCCSSAYPVCCSDYCCPDGCFCDGFGGCDCPGDFGLPAHGALGSASAEGRSWSADANISYW